MAKRDRQDNHSDAEARVASSMSEMERLVESRDNEGLTRLAHQSNDCEGQPGYEGYEASKR